MSECENKCISLKQVTLKRAVKTAFIEASSVIPPCKPITQYLSLNFHLLP